MKQTKKYQFLFQEDYWTYAPELIKNPQNYFEALLPHFENVCKTYDMSMYGKTFPSRRISCLYTDHIEDVENANAKSGAFNYAQTPAYEFSTAPIELVELREFIENYFGYKTDYVLCHVYRDGTDYLGWHNDKEALNSEVFSVSFGATRSFQFRFINSKDVEDELILQSGDVVHMHGPRTINGKTTPSCQRVYKHRVGKMLISDLQRHISENGIEIPKGRKTYNLFKAIIDKNNILPVRINLTFRQYED